MFKKIFFSVIMIRFVRARRGAFQLTRRARAPAGQMQPKHVPPAAPSAQERTHMPPNPPGPRGGARERGVVSFVFTCPPLARTRPKSTGSTSGIIEPRTKYSQANRPICQLSQTTGAYDTGMSIAIVQL